jgi:hypothetical protein
MVLPVGQSVLGGRGIRDRGSGAIPANVPTRVQTCVGANPSAISSGASDALISVAGTCSTSLVDCKAKALYGVPQVRKAQTDLLVANSTRNQLSYS